MSKPEEGMPPYFDRNKLQKICCICKAEFETVSRNKRYCNDCGKQVRKERSNNYATRAKR